MHNPCDSVRISCMHAAESKKPKSVTGTLFVIWRARVQGTGQKSELKEERESARGRDRCRKERRGRGVIEDSGRA
jgi:hypothetical protein